MAASIELHEMSALGTGVDKTSGTVRIKMADNSTVDLSNPIVVPTGADVYSMTKTLRAYMEDAPSAEVSNLRLYTAGVSFGTGITVNIKNLGVTWSANSIVALVAATDLFSYTSVSPFDMDATDAGPFVPGDVDTYIGDLARMQMVVANTASHGLLAAKTLTFAWDEI